MLKLRRTFLLNHVVAAFHIVLLTFETHEWFLVLKPHCFASSTTWWWECCRCQLCVNLCQQTFTGGSSIQLFLRRVSFEMTNPLAVDDNILGQTHKWFFRRFVQVWYGLIIQLVVTQPDDIWWTIPCIPISSLVKHPLKPQLPLNRTTGQAILIGQH